MINTILIGIVGFVAGVITSLSNPLSSFIAQNLPDVNNALSNVSTFLVQVATYLDWSFELVGIPFFIAGVLSFTWGFKLTIPVLIYILKVVIKWWHQLVP